MEYNTAFYHLGAFLVYIVLWLICSSDIPQFFINANETVSLVSFLSLSIMGIHFAAYTRIILQEGEKWFRFLSYIGWIDPLIILTGPTAVGKSALSVELAKKINGAVISADSMGSGRSANSESSVYRHGGVFRICFCN